MKRYLKILVSSALIIFFILLWLFWIAPSNIHSPIMHGYEKKNDCPGVSAFVEENHMGITGDEYCRRFSPAGSSFAYNRLTKNVYILKGGCHLGCKFRYEKLENVTVNNFELLPLGYGRSPDYVFRALGSQKSILEGVDSSTFKVLGPDTFCDKNGTYQSYINYNHLISKIGDGCM